MRLHGVVGQPRLVHADDAPRLDNLDHLVVGLVGVVGGVADSDAMLHQHLRELRIMMLEILRDRPLSSSELERANVPRVQPGLAATEPFVVPMPAEHAELELLLKHGARDEHVRVVDDHAAEDGHVQLAERIDEVLQPVLNPFGYDKRLARLGWRLSRLLCSASCGGARDAHAEIACRELRRLRRALALADQLACVDVGSLVVAPSRALVTEVGLHSCRLLGARGRGVAGHGAAFDAAAAFASAALLELVLVVPQAVRIHEPLGPCCFG